MIHQVKVKQLHHRATIAKRATSGSSGFDLHCLDVVKIGHQGRQYNDEFRHYALYPGERVLVRTGLSLSMPEGLEAHVRSRSGLALNYGIQAHFGTIDADYRGDVGVILFNLGEVPFIIHRGDRVAQLVFVKIAPIDMYLVEDLDETNRGVLGFGSTGRQ